MINNIQKANKTNMVIRKEYIKKTGHTLMSL